jgi:hypothetical protein
VSKRESVAWGYNWATLFLGDINTGTSSSRLWGVDASLTILFCEKKEIIVGKSEKVKTGSNLAESCKKVYGLK